MQYEEAMRVIHKVIERHRAANPYGDPAEQLQEAQLVYVETLRDYDPERGAFSTILWCRVEGRLRELDREAAKESARLQFVPNEWIEHAEATAPGFDLSEFLETLSDDAATLAQEALRIFVGPNLPAQTVWNFRTRFGKRLNQAMRALGWREGRIDKAREEIELALS